MDVLVAGGHGEIARHLLRLLAEHGHHGRGLIRNPDHAADLEADGAVPVLCDLEHDDPRPHLGARRRDRVRRGRRPGQRARAQAYGRLRRRGQADRGGRGARRRRYLIVSSMGAGDPASASEAMRPYQQAKHDADEALPPPAWTGRSCAPGGLTDEPGGACAERLGRSAGPAPGRRARAARVPQAPNTVARRRGARGRCRSERCPASRSHARDGAPSLQPRKTGAHPSLAPPDPTRGPPSRPTRLAEPSSSTAAAIEQQPRPSNPDRLLFARRRQGFPSACDPIVRCSA